MLTTNHHYCSGFKKLILPFLLFLFLGACNERTEETPSSGTIPTSTSEPTSTNDRPVVAAAPLTGYLYDLELTKAQYLRLRNANPGGGNSDKMVFQFYFDNLLRPNGPTLVAYATNRGGGGNRFGANPDPLVGRDTVVLWITGTPRLNLSAAPVNGNFTLGDQEISFNLIESRYTLDLTTGPGSTDFVLEFKPALYGKNIRYNVCLRGTPCPTPPPATQPSPPANTN